MSDVDYIKTLQTSEAYQFEVTEVGGQTPKNDRIRRLIPWFEQGRVFLPRSFSYTAIDGKTTDLVSDFIEQEYCPFPVGLHDDMIDALSRICEPDLELKKPNIKIQTVNTHYFGQGGGGWMG
jgi:phage terminase large subunit-like protein